MMSKTQENIEKLETSLLSLHNNDCVIYFLTYDTKIIPERLLNIYTTLL
jgi:hypothetical protein